MTSLQIEHIARKIVEYVSGLPEYDLAGRRAQAELIVELLESVEDANTVLKGDWLKDLVS